jgi:hypothetical protein
VQGAYCSITSSFRRDETKDHHEDLATAMAVLARTVPNGLRQVHGIANETRVQGACCSIRG